MKRLLFVSFLLLSLSSQLWAQKSFAIVIDPKSYEEATGEVLAYAEAIEQTQELKTQIIIDRWGIPDSIRKELHRLYLQKKSPLEGVVFIGDIPIVMVRDAQHMTSAFKMDQKYPRKDSSIPSDRFYDDFDLDFEYICKDSDAPYYYYSLKPSSEQYLHPDIYSGRIRPTDVNGTSRYDKLRAYLRKVVREKQANHQLDQMLYYSGHGYISESMVARIDEKKGLYEHFPWLDQQQNGIGFIDHSQDRNVKFRLMNEMMRPELDFALLHHHGAWNTQYMNGIPQPNSADEAKAYIQAYGRAHLRYAQEKGKDVKEMQQKLMERFDVPQSWFNDTFTPASIYKDSLENDNLDLYIKDFSVYSYQPNARIVMIDACFCGSFHREDCIANEYIFSEGNTVVCIGNTVNVLQDKWSDRYIGLLGLGMNAGNLARFSNYLESHTIGDPTFRFVSKDKRYDVQRLLADTSVKGWKKILKETSYADLQCMAIEQLHHAQQITSGQLLHLFQTTPYAMVRVECLYALSEIGNDDFIEAIRLACNDSYELVQRFGVRFLGKNGDPRLIPALIRLAISNNTSERTNFNTMSALSFFPEKELVKEFDKQFNSSDIHYIDKEKVGQTIRKTIISSANKWTDEVEEILSDDTKEKTKKQNIRGLRNYCPHHCIHALLSYLDRCQEPDIKVMLLEALGWQNYSFMRSEMATKAKAISLDNAQPEAVRKEALKTYNRLTTPYPQNRN